MKETYRFANNEKRVFVQYHHVQILFFELFFVVPYVRHFRNYIVVPHVPSCGLIYHWLPNTGSMPV